MKALPLLICLVFASCSSYDPADAWGQVPVDAEMEKELAVFEEVDLKCLVAEYENHRNKKKICDAVPTR
jgi:hypothetical protein